MNAQETSGEVTRDGQSGQATTEYALLVFWTVCVVIPVLVELLNAIPNSFQDIASVICLPIP